MNFRADADRSAGGNVLLLCLLVAFIVSLVALAAFWLIRMVGGSAELGSATDAGTLNVAKQVVSSVGVPLLPEEMNEFGDLVDTNGLITLRTYNGVVARAILVVLNAQELNTDSALSAAREVANMAQCGKNSIGKRLHDAVESPANNKGAFESVSAQTSKWMIGSVALSDHDCEYAFLNRDAASNVYLDYRFINADSIARLTSLDALFAGTDGKTYFKGYHTIDLGSGFVFQLITLPVGTEPHLISDSNFNRGAEAEYASTLPSSLVGQVPPNCIRIVSLAPVGDLRDQNNTVPSKQLSSTGEAANKYSSNADQKTQSVREYTQVDDKDRPDLNNLRVQKQSKIAKSTIPQSLRAHSNAVVAPLNYTIPACFATNSQQNGHIRQFFFPPAVTNQNRSK
jgi:hypothetical protein